MRAYAPNIEIRGVMAFDPLKTYINTRDFIREK